MTLCCALVILYRRGLRYDTSRIWYSFYGRLITVIRLIPTHCDHQSLRCCFCCKPDTHRRDLNDNVSKTQIQIFFINDIYVACGPAIWVAR
jgi:hypothetical protein